MIFFIFLIQQINNTFCYYCVMLGQVKFSVIKHGVSLPDINECRQKNGGCSHLCINQNGGYKCACPASHRLSSYSWKKCLPRMTANTAGWGGEPHCQAWGILQMSVLFCCRLLKNITFNIVKEIPLVKTLTNYSYNLCTIYSFSLFN